MGRFAVLVATGGLVMILGGPAMAQRPEMTGTAWPSRHRGGTVLSGEVTKVNPDGTVTVKTPEGERTVDIKSSTVPGLAVGDRVDIQTISTGRPASAVGGEAAEPGQMSRILPPLPAQSIGIGLQESPGSLPGVSPPVIAPVAPPVTPPPAGALRR
jgi:hypothetical protein